MAKDKSQIEKLREENDDLKFKVAALHDEFRKEIRKKWSQVPAMMIFKTLSNSLVPNMTI